MKTCALLPGKDTRPAREQGNKGPSGSGTWHRGKGADEWPSGKRDDEGKKGGKKGSKVSKPDWHGDKDKGSKGKPRMCFFLVAVASWPSLRHRPPSPPSQLTRQRQVYEQCDLGFAFVVFQEVNGDELSLSLARYSPRRCQERPKVCPKATENLGGSTTHSCPSIRAIGPVSCCPREGSLSEHQATRKWGPQGHQSEAQEVAGGQRARGLGHMLCTGGCGS